jgi:chromosome segregation ATPase
MDEILNTNNLNNVRFRMSKPQGYFTEDVEEFIDVQVKQSLSSYEKEIASLKKQLAASQSTIDEQNQRLLNFEVQSSFNEASSTIETDESLMKALEKNEELEAEILRLNGVNSSLRTEASGVNAKITELQSTIDQLNTHTAELNSYIDELQPLLEQGANAIEELERIKAGEQVAPALPPEPVAEVEDLTSYESEADVEITSRHKKEKPVIQEEDFSSAAATSTDDMMEFDMTPEVDVSVLDEALSELESKGDYDPNEFETLPDGTIVPKGVKPEDL